MFLCEFYTLLLSGVMGRTVLRGHAGWGSILYDSQVDTTQMISILATFEDEILVFKQTIGYMIVSAQHNLFTHRISACDRPKANRGETRTSIWGTLAANSLSCASETWVMAMTTSTLCSSIKHLTACWAPEKKSVNIFKDIAVCRNNRLHGMTGANWTSSPGKDRVGVERVQSPKRPTLSLPSSLSFHFCISINFL